MLELSRLIRGDPSQPALIFLHGFLGVKEDWEELISFFEDRFYCIAFDLPGHGESPYSEEILTTIKQAIQRIIHFKPICIGYSMGGRIALQLQDCVCAIAALSAHPGLTTQLEKEQRRLIDEKWSQKLLELSLDAFLAEWYAQPIFQTLKRNPALLQNIMRRRMKQSPSDLALVLHQLSLSKQPYISEFSCPTLFLHGEEDLKYRELYSRLPNSAAVSCVKSCGHAVHIENAADCAQLINHWIEVMHANT